MTIEQLKKRKMEIGFSNKKLAEVSGLPLGTVQKIMSGATKNPRYETLTALRKALFPSPSSSDDSVEPGYPVSLGDGSFVSVVREALPAYSAAPRVHTFEEIDALPEGVHAELIDGQIYYMATPTRTHQKICGEMYLIVAQYIRSHGGSCEVFIPPYGIFLMGDESTYIEPDLTVICDPEKSQERGCIGAPDWVVEVVSPSSRHMDYAKKLFKYRTAGVREYWIIDPSARQVFVYIFDRECEAGKDFQLFRFEDEIPVHIYPDLTIRLADTV